jgi:hypothetical protein
VTEVPVNLGQFMEGLTVVVGVVVMVRGAVTRRRDGNLLLLLGAALIPGPGAMLLRGYVSEPVIVVSMAVSAALSVAAAILLWGRKRRAQA